MSDSRCVRGLRVFEVFCPRGPGRPEAARLKDVKVLEASPVQRREGHKVYLNAMSH